jgi:rod shape determining protein RodA
MAAPKQQSQQFGEIDRMTLMIYLALVFIGWLMIFAVNYNAKDPLSFLDLSHDAGKQLFFMVVCFVMFFFIFVTDWTFWRAFSFIIYIVSLFLLVGTVFLGREINGAKAWYQLGGFSFQPAEIAKFATCLAMSSYLSSTSVNLREWKSRITAFAIFLIPAIIMSPVMQDDTGSALVLFSFMLVLYREGLDASWYMLGFGVAALVILGLVFPPAYVVSALLLIISFRFIAQFRDNRPWIVVLLALIPLTIWWKEAFSWFLTMSAIDPATIKPDLETYVLIPNIIYFLTALIPTYLKKNSLVQRSIQLQMFLLGGATILVFLANFFCYTVLAPHQQERIKVWLRPQECDPRGALYNVLHSKMAIGAGGLTGKGFLEGNMTKLKYVPEQSTDFIFCTVGEEHGFIGTVSIIVLFAMLLYRLTVLAERQRSNFSRLYCYCVAGIIFMHFIINIGMTMGLFPIIGIPLPFISYGGSSLIGFTLMIGVLLKLDSHRNFA